MNKITIKLKMFHALEKYLPAKATKGQTDMVLDKGANLGDLLASLGIPEQEPKIILINGQSQGVCTTVKSNPILNEGDTVSIFPPVAGG